MVKAVVTGEAELKKLSFIATNKQEREEAALVAVGGEKAADGADSES
jgi:hypothetical protein